MPHQLDLLPTDLGPCTAPPDKFRPGGSRPTGSRGRRLPQPRWSANATIALLGSIVVSFLAGSSAPTPLYATYQKEWGFSPITTTVIFGIYAIAVLTALLTLGRLSDHVGRRPVLLIAIAVQVVSMIVFITAPDVTALLIARVIQGLSTGAAVGAIGAAMIDVNRARGTIANAIAPGMGTATGALASGIVVQLFPAPTHLIYEVLIGIFVLQAIGVLLLRETVTRAPGGLATLVPDIRLPKQARSTMLGVTPVLVAVWALAGFYGALSPALTRHLTGSNSAILGGLGLFLLAGVGAVSIAFLRDAPTRFVMLVGVSALIFGVAVTLVAMSADSATGYFVGTAIAGVGFGSGFQGGVRTVVPLAAPHERSGVLSLLYMVSYLAMGLPAVIGGFLVVDVSGLMTTAREYGLAVIVLAALALAGQLRRRPVTPGPGAAAPRSTA